MSEHLQFDEDFDLYALGALDPEERLAFEAHLRTCEDCEAKLAAARERVGLMALSATPIEPPARIKQQLMSRIHEEAAAEGRTKNASHVSGAAISPRTPERIRIWKQPKIAWTFALAAAVVCLVFVFDNSRLHQQVHDYQAVLENQRASIARAHAVLDLLTAKDTQSITLTAASEKPRPQGKVYYHPNRGLIFYATNMPAAPENKTYQLWLVPSQGVPISAGVFDPAGKGDASIVLPDLPQGVTAKAFAVTVEPKGGVPQPTGEKVLIGAL